MNCHFPQSCLMLRYAPCIVTRLLIINIINHQSVFGWNFLQNILFAYLLKFDFSIVVPIKSETLKSCT